MTTQFLLDFAATRDKPIQQRFDEFHHANPQVYTACITFHEERPIWRDWIHR
jgi:hypothetical protein